jgi:DNA-binding NarL/FixJ family response regulator
MPILDGIEVARRLQGSSVPVLILSAFAERNTIREAFANGVAGYLTKAEAPEYLAGAIQAVANNRTWFSPVIINKMMAAGQNGAMPHQNGAPPQSNEKTAGGSSGEDQDRQPTS